MTRIMEQALTLEMTHRFAAPPERVYDAWLSAQWGAWLGPHGARCEKVDIDARVGGRYAVAMITPDGGALTIHGVYQDLERPRKIRFTWNGCGHGESVVTLNFQPDGAGTIMTLQHTGFDGAGRRDGANAGWTATFEKLEVFLAVVPPPPQ